jgi:hypothetical protein
MMRLVATVAAYLGALWVAAMISIFGLISLVGPHSAPLPKAWEPVVYFLAGAVILVVPIVAALKVWRSQGAKQ